MPKVVELSPSMGCDPEFFLKDKEGSTIGSEKFIPKGGIRVGGSKFIIDGVQAELNPAPSTCRALLGMILLVAL